MSKKKPPPRPPLPQVPSVSVPAPKASISIRYNPSTVEVDSDEEISIVRESKLSPQSSAEELEKLQPCASLQDENGVRQPDDTKASNPELSDGQAPSSFKKFFFSKAMNKSPPLSKAAEKQEDSLEIPISLSASKSPSLTSVETTPMDDFEHVDLCCDDLAGGGGEKQDKSASSNREKTLSPPLLKVESNSRNHSRSSSPIFDSSPRSISPQIFRSSKMSFTALLASRRSPEPESEAAQEAEKEACSEPVKMSDTSPSSENQSFDSSFHVVKPIPLKSAPSMTPESTEIPYMFLWICTMFFYTYYICHVPSFIHGIVVGAELMYLVGCLFLWIFSPEESLQLKFERELKEYESRRRHAPKVEITSKDPGELMVPSVMKGWMYRCDEYETDDEKSSSELTLVHVLLSGKDLIISYPTSEVEKKVRSQGHFTKDYSDLKFLQEDKYSLENGQVALHPPELSVKKVWNRKFPLCVTASIVSSSDDWHVLGEENDSFEAKSPPLSVSPTGSDKSEEIQFQCENEVFYLFARAGRDKEEWFNRLRRATRGEHYEILAASQDYPHYMAKLIPDSSSGSQPHSQVAWVNVLFGRIFWDVWQDDYWTNKLKQRIQTKLGKLKLPYFIRYLKITDLNIGESFPAITKAYPPTLNERGTWVDLDVTYSGAFVLTLETSVNIEYYRTLVADMAKEGGHVEDDCNLLLEQKVEFSRVNNAPDESSDHMRSVGDELDDWDSDHESELSVPHAAPTTNPSTSPSKNPPRVFPQSAKGKKIMGMVERIAKNKWVQKAAETKFVQKAVEKFSNMPITLTVQVQRIKGTLTLNIPPPPTDRLWYGFRETPMLFVSARPKLGERQIKLTHVTDWIEKKLKQEFKGMFVLPHMEDLTIRLMNSGLEEEFQMLQGAK